MSSPIQPFGSSIVQAGLDLLFPPRCAGCGRFDRYLCETCKTSLVRFSFSLCPMCDRPTLFGKTHSNCKTDDSPDGQVLFYQYLPPISLYIKAIKYSGVYDAVRELPSLLQSGWPAYGPDLDLLVPVPLSTEKQSIRGFNQAEMICFQLSQVLQKPMNRFVLSKITETTPQASKKRKARKKLEQCFAVIEPSAIQGLTVGLVDDVATTGSTLRVATQAIKWAGAKSVWCVTLAHAY